MRISTGLSNINIYTNITKHGYIMLQFVNGNDFQNAQKIFFSVEDTERFIGILDHFLNNREISNPVQIAVNKANSLSAITQNEHLILILSIENIGHTNIPLTKLNAKVLRRFLSYYPVYGVITDMRNATANYQQKRTYNQHGNNNFPGQQVIPPQQVNNNMQQHQNFQQQANIPSQQINNMNQTNINSNFSSQEENIPSIGQQVNNNIPQQQSTVPTNTNIDMSDNTTTDDILNELDNLIM